jgi:ABC-type protease/lipase transport system fused ATPase/permease subunit
LAAPVPIAAHTKKVLVAAGHALPADGRPSGGATQPWPKGIVGVWPQLRGSVKLNDADLDQWRADARLINGFDRNSQEAALGFTHGPIE